MRQSLSSSIRFFRQLVLLTLLPVTAIAAERQPAAAAPRFGAVRVETRGDTVTMSVRTSAPTTYRAQLLDAPVRLVLDLEDTAFAWPQGRLDLTRPPLRQIRGSQFTKDVSRVVLEFTGFTPYVVLNEHDGIRIDVGARTQAWSEGSAAATPISLDVREGGIVNLLRTLAVAAGKNLVIDDEVKGKMSVTAKDVPPEQALDIIVESRGLAKIEKGNVVRITTQDQLARERHPESNLRQPRVPSENAKARTGVRIRTAAAEAALKGHEVEQRDYAAEHAARGPLAQDRARGHAPAIALTLVTSAACVGIGSVWWRLHRRSQSSGSLVMADGALTARLAAWGALASTVFGKIKASDSSRDRPVVKVSLRPGIQAVRATREYGAVTLLHVKVANVGRRPTSITHVSLMLPRWCAHKYVLCTDPRTATYPVELRERRTHSFVFNADLLAEEFGLTRSRFVARVDDGAGRSHWSHGKLARIWKLGRFA
jgi:hypothetical protein